MGNRERDEKPEKQRERETNRRVEQRFQLSKLQCNLLCPSVFSRQAQIYDFNHSTSIKGNAHQV